jgi:hypothetical protein
MIILNMIKIHCPYKIILVDTDLDKREGGVIFSTVL